MRTSVRMFSFVAIGMALTSGSADAALALRNLRLDHLSQPAAQMVKADFQPAPIELLQIWQTYGSHCRGEATDR